jgi:carbon-monoxide dehydrogenase medium subunit
MSLPKFEYFEPKTVEEACSILSDKHKENVRVLAGGTDILVRMKERIITPKCLVNIKEIPNLDTITYDEKEGLRIGALATLSSIETSLVIQEKFPLLATSAGDIGSPQIRNLGTIGGNLCHASPSADTAPALIALGATVKLVEPKGERVLLLEDFFIDPFKTELNAAGLLTEIQVPTLPPKSGGVYLKHGKKEMVDIAIVGVASVITLESTNGVCKDIKIVLGAVAPIPLRAKKAEEILKGKKPEEGIIEEAAKVASEEARPITDIRGSAEYRKEMVKVFTRRATNQALMIAKAN